MVSDTQPRLTLGSASPRRAALLESIGVSFAVETVDIDERELIDGFEGDPGQAVTRVAQAKFAAFRKIPGNSIPLLTADTLVACDGAILGKPRSSDHLVQMMQHMSGRPLTIATAVCYGDRGQEPAMWLVPTTIVLRELSWEEITTYVATGAGFDKAGGLALQSEAGAFIEQVDGCWSNVLGLPLCVVSLLLDRDADNPAFEAAPMRHHRCSVDLCGSR